MDASLKFDKRVRTIARKNRRIARGHTSYIDAMGVIRKKPKRSVLNLPIKGVLMLVLGFAIFKAVILAADGRGAYERRLDLLAEGTIFEQVGAWVLQIDPVTRVLAGLFGSVL